MLMSLDLSATLFGAYRVVLPALCATVFHVGPTGLRRAVRRAVGWGAARHLHGVPGGGPDAGGSAGCCWCRPCSTGWRMSVWRRRTSSPIAVLAGLLIGAFDAMATTIRHAAVQLETPDELRGRVSAIYQMSSRGGPALGDTLVGAVAGVVGPVTALTLGGVLAAVYAGVLHGPAESGPRVPGVAQEEEAARRRRELDTPDW